MASLITLTPEPPVDDATMKVVSFDDDFHGGVLGIHEGWSRPWLGQVDKECGRFGI